MIRRDTWSHSRGFLSIVLTFSVWFLVSCASFSSPKKTEVSPEFKAKYEKLKVDYNKLKRTLKKRNVEIKALEERVAKLQLGVLEKDAQLKQLNAQQGSQQEMLDEAIQEVVRAKAKLRSLESKAEAASTMAEAEIAVKALKAQFKTGAQNPEVVQAERLLAMGAQEFRKENYGGALYLTSQAKSHIRRGRMQLAGKEVIVAVEGEVIFAQPVPLRVLRNSNLREGPDLKNKVVTRLAKGATVIGYSYKGQWVRVTTDLGINGWIYQSLVGGR